MKTSKLLTALLLACASLPSFAQTPDWIKSIKLSGYGMTQYQMSTKDNAKSNTFGLRLARVSLDGRIANDFYWKAQVQINGNTSTLGSSPRIVDLFAEWQKYNFARIKVGQFKLPFTFENPMHPITQQGFMGYSQVVSALSGFSDRAGAHSSNGRDIGVQIQGDFLPNAAGRDLLHYQVGVFNGQGINVTDVDQRKDIVGGMWVMPVKGMRLGAFGMVGSYARKGNWTETALTGASVVEHTGEVRSLSQRRYAFSAEYLVNDWTFRTEYIHSTGDAFAKRLNNTNGSEASDCSVNTANGSKAQGVYAVVFAPIVKKKLHAKARYDMYQPTGDSSKQKTQYEIGLNWDIQKNFTILSEYALVNDRSLAKHNYSMVDVEVCFRF